jgi:predicted dehydrogenase
VISYRNSSGYQELCKMVKSGKIGNVFHMDANYYQSWLTSNLAQSISVCLVPKRTQKSQYPKSRFVVAIE